MFQPARRILVPVHLAEEADRLMAYAAALGRDNEAEIHLLHVLPALPTMYRADTDELAEWEKEQRDVLEQRARKRLAALAAHPAGRGLSVETSVKWSVAIYHTIIEEVARWKADRIVMGSHGRTGLSYVLLGSVANKVIRHAPCPVLVVKRRQPEVVDDDGNVALGHILFPSDGSEAAAAAAPLAASLARAHDAAIIAVQVIPPPALIGPHVGMPVTAAAELEDAARQRFEPKMRALFDDVPRLEVVVATGPSARTLCTIATEREAELIVIASHGRNRLGDHLIGSVAERVVRHAPCGVCVVPSRSSD